VPITRASPAHKASAIGRAGTMLAGLTQPRSTRSFAPVRAEACAQAFAASGHRISAYCGHVPVRPPGQRPRAERPRAGHRAKSASARDRGPRQHRSQKDPARNPTRSTTGRGQASVPRRQGKTRTARSPWQRRPIATARAVGRPQREPPSMRAGQEKQARHEPRNAIASASPSRRRSRAPRARAPKKPQS
jgi:hypothetical protein